MIELETRNLAMKKEGDVLYTFYKEDCLLDLESVKKDVEARLELQKGENCYVVTDMTHLKNASKEAREYLSNPEGGLRGITAGAFVSSGIFTYAILNLFIRILIVRNPS